MKLFLAGTCQVDAIVAAAIEEGHSVDHFLFGSKEHDILSYYEEKAGYYDARIVGLTLRNLIKDATDDGNELIFWRLDEIGRNALLLRLLDNIDNILSKITATFNNKFTVFIGFIEPSQSYVGNVFRYDLELDFKEFVHELNRGTKRLVSQYDNCYFLDPNPVFDAVGRNGAQSDVMSSSTHASFVGNWDYDADAGRIVPPVLPSDVFRPGGRSTEYGKGILTEVDRLIHAVSGRDKIKLIIVDLDDTLWRGIAAEDDLGTDMRREGWPLGLVEALLIFKRRGGLLAIASKNSYEETKERFKDIWRSTMTLEDFVSVKINWNPKSQSVAEILEEVNLLPENVLFLDDNPREIEEVKIRFPQIRSIGFNHYLWRKIIIEGHAFSTATISQESKRKTDLIKAKINRDEQSKKVDRAEWLSSLGLNQRHDLLSSMDSVYTQRALELLNKTNQFNTNGIRWSSDELTKHFIEGGKLLVAHVADKNVDNGLVGVVVIKDDNILQSTLSCRVFGLGVEIAMMSAACRLVLSKHRCVFGSVNQTGKNFVCLDIFDRLGFSGDGFKFQSTIIPDTPDWILVTEDFD